MRSKSLAKASRGRKSTASRKARKGLPTASTGSPNRKASGKNSRKHEADQDDPRLKVLLQQAIDLKNAKDYAAAIRVLADSIREYPKCAPAHALMGSIYLHKLKQMSKAVDCFQKALHLSPKSEGASLGLFHSLWEANRQVEALEEMKRFQAVSHSKDYDEILAEIKEKWLSD